MHDTVGVFVKIFFLLTPFFVLSLFVTLTRELELSRQRALAMRTSLAVLVICLILYFFGDRIFSYLGITLDAFRVGSGDDPADKTGLAHYLEGKNDKEILSFARHVSQVFVVYASYRADWVMRWLGIHPELLGEEPAAERRALESHPDFLWQRELWKRLAAHPQQRSRTFFAELPESLEVLARSRGKRLIRLDEHRTVRLPDALHVFVPFVVPPLMLPVVKAYAQSGRDVCLYLLNPSSEKEESCPRVISESRK